MKNVLKVIDELSQMNITTKSKKYVEDDIANAWTMDIIITMEKYYEVIYNISQEKFRLATTFSNQELTNEYLTKLMNIQNILNRYN